MLSVAKHPFPRTEEGFFTEFILSEVEGFRMTTGRYVRIRDRLPFLNWKRQNARIHETAINLSIP